MAHAHAPPPDQRARLGIVLLVTGAILAVEVAGALLSGSLALFADAGHMLTDVAGLWAGLPGRGAVPAAGDRRSAPGASGGRRSSQPRRRPRCSSRWACSSSSRASGGCSTHRRSRPAIMLVFGAVGLVGNLVSLAVLAAAAVRT